MAAVSSLLNAKVINFVNSKASNSKCATGQNHPLSLSRVNASSIRKNSNKADLCRERSPSNLFGTQIHIPRSKVTTVSSKRHRSFIRAAEKDDSKKDDVPEFKGFPPMQGKPAWYWRILACVPYILPFCEGWLYAKPALYLFPALELYEAFTMPVWQIIGKLPGWFLIAYILTAYTFIVRNNRWPHFIRFHVVNGMLLEIFLQAIGILNDWLPRSIYWGTLGTHFWLFMSISYFFTVSLCIMYALRGMYADVPFTSDASYMQIPYE